MGTFQSPKKIKKMKLGFFLAAFVAADGHMGSYEGDGECATGRNPDVCKLEADLSGREVQDLVCCGEDDGCAIATLEDVNGTVPDGKIHCDMFPNHGLADNSTTTPFAGLSCCIPPTTTTEAPTTTAATAGAASVTASIGAALLAFFFH